MKKIVTLILAIALLASIIPSSSVYADSKVLGTYSTLSFTSSSVYDVVATGNYSAVKMNDVWYYKFEKDSQIVYVKISAFMAAVGNPSNSATNSALTSGINAGTNSTTTRYIVHKAKCKEYNNSLQDYNHIYHMVKQKVSVIAPTGGNSITLQTEMLNPVTFTYCNKVRLRSTIVTPDNASLYKKALKRSSNTGKLKIKPTFGIKITNAGTKQNYFVSNLVRAKGYAHTTANIDKLISIGYTTVSGAVSGLKLSTVYKLYKECVSLKVESKEYVSNKTIILSDNDPNNPKKFNYCRKAVFSSPIDVSKAGDYFKIPILLNQSLNVKATNLKFSIEYSFDSYVG